MNSQTTRSRQSAVHTRSFAPGLVAIAALLPMLFCLPAHAQEGLKQLSRLELALDGDASLTQNSSGTTPVSSGVNYKIAQTASTATGGMATIRYTKSPLIGGEFNFNMTVLTEGYTLTPALALSANPFTVQAQMQEYTFGYVAHGPHIMKFQSFASAGFGSIKFKPTAHGGEGLQAQYRMAEYVSAGVDDPIFTKDIGIRVQIRDVFYKAPDFGQSYLTTNAHTSTIEPVFGFYMRF
jgi:hypothetical protein